MSEDCKETDVKQFLKDLIAAGQKMTTNGNYLGVFIPKKDWERFENQASLSKWCEPRDTERYDDWSYNLNEAELGLFALMSYYGENTPQPFGAPEEIRFIGRVPEALRLAIKDLANGRRNGSYRHTLNPATYKRRFAGIKFHNDHWLHGLDVSLDNGAEICRTAKEHYNR